MSFEEKRAWVMVLVTVAAYAAYAVVVLTRAQGAQMTEVAYAAPLLWSIGGAIGASFLLHIALSTFSPAGANEKDQRDREIHRLGQYIGQSFLVIGAVAALSLALAEWDSFWIANVIYLGFALSAVTGSVVKIVAYRRGFQSW
jgi:hypothetical protein